jgi:hypothetical protein
VADLNLHRQATSSLPLPPPSLPLPRAYKRPGAEKETAERAGALARASTTTPAV